MNERRYHYGPYHNHRTSQPPLAGLDVDQEVQAEADAGTYLAARSRQGWPQAQGAASRLKPPSSPERWAGGRQAPNAA